MGMIWKSIMPLLSTLAAMVILVHTAEEDMEHRQLALRQTDASARNFDYDQTWRAIRNEPTVQESKEWNDPSLLDSTERPRRRRPGRKRKRRPTIEQTVEPDGRRHYHEEPETRQEADYTIKQDNADHNRKRRKRPEMRPWIQEEEKDRSLRRRGQRRKRPKFNEFNAFHGYERSPDNQRPYDETYKEDKYSDDDQYKKTDVIEIDVKSEEDDAIKNTSKDERNNEDAQHDISVPGSLTEENSSIMKIREEEQMLTPEELTIAKVQLEAIMKRLHHRYKNTIKYISQMKTSTKQLKQNITEDRKAISKKRKPSILKDLLKKLNGSSLIEFLQENNLTLNDLLKGDKMALSVLKHQNNFKKRLVEDEMSQYQQKKVFENDSNEKKTQSEKSNDSIAIEITYIYNTNETKSSPKNKTELHDKHESGSKMQPEILDLKENSPKIVRKNPFFNKGRRRIRVHKPEILTQQSFSHEGSKRLQRNNQLNAPEKHHESSNKLNNTEKFSSRSQLAVMEDVTTQDSEYLENIDSTTTASTTTTTEEIITTEGSYEDESNELVDDTTVTPTTTTESDIIEIQTEEVSLLTTTERNIVTPIIRAKPSNTSHLRRQALTNRLKRKRLVQKASHTVSAGTPSRDLYGMTNLVSASEFIAHSPKTSNSNDLVVTTLQDFFATEASTRVDKPYRITPHTIPKVPKTEETAKIEIAEILDDDHTSARLSKILMERNMTLSELAEHRERGSSNVHLADIFHNTSREPNPPEPFLSKSSIEPISKGIYPLRALLEANHHDPVVKITSIEPFSSQTMIANVPVVMNYKNNVNENGENLGIMSLFDKITNNLDEHAALKKDSDGTIYVTSITAENITTVDNSRTGRELIISTPPKPELSELFSFMQRTYNDGRKQITESLSRQPDPILLGDVSTKATLPESSDEDEFIVSEDLQHLKEFNSNIASASDEDMEMKMTENEDSKTETQPTGVLDKIPNGTKSITVATASILGLTMVVFLLTYVLFKWKKQRSLLRNKENYPGERIPTPVFETRKGNNNQSSTRSISPMLSSSNNIYTMNTLDSRDSDESPEYMWDSLRKSFQ